MKQNLKFNYGDLNFNIISFNQSEENLPVIKGTVTLNITPIKKDFYRDFWFYNLCVNTLEQRRCVF